MLKGLKGILEKGLQIAAPFIGNMLLPGVGGAMLGSGIASLLTGNKPKDALLAMGGTYLSGIGNPQGSPLSSLLNFGQKGPATATSIIPKKPIGTGTFFSNPNNPNFANFNALTPAILPALANAPLTFPIPRTAPFAPLMPILIIMELLAILIALYVFYCVVFFLDN